MFNRDVLCKESIVRNPHIECLPSLMGRGVPLGWGELFQPNGESVKILIN